eukprot:PhF_6_TR14143/c0_g1_i1/m.22623
MFSSRRPLLCKPTHCWKVALAQLTGTLLMYQEDRMPSSELVVYDTAQRRTIRSTLLQMALNATSRNRVYLTGIGGSGKSHNLALFAQQAKELGHVVVYINTVEAWVQFPNLLSIAAWQAAIAVASTAKARGVPIPSFLQKPCPRPSSSGKGLDKVELDGTVELRDLCDALGIRLIFIVDQENHLHRASPSDSSQISECINSVPAHLAVLSASANNEGWVIRNWKKKIQHYPEPVPGDVILKLFPHMALFKKQNENDYRHLRALLMEEYNNYPLMLHRADMYLQYLPNSTVPEIANELKNELRQQIMYFWEKVHTNPLKLLDATKSVWEGEQIRMEPKCYDKNHFYFKSNQLLPIFNEVIAVSRDVFQPNQSFLAQAPSSLKYEMYFYIAAKGLLVASDHLVGFHSKFLANPYFTIADLSTDEQQDKNDIFFFMNCPRGRGGDFYSVQEQLRTVHLVVYQLTLNTHHKDTFSDINAEYRGGRSLLSTMLQAMKEYYHLSSLEVHIVYVTPNKQLDLTDATGNITHTLSHSNMHSVQDFIPSQLHVIRQREIKKNKKINMKRQSRPCPEDYSVFEYLVCLSLPEIVFECTEQLKGVERM